MTKKIQVSWTVCSATAAGRDFGPLKALIEPESTLKFTETCMLLPDKV